MIHDYFLEVRILGLIPGIEELDEAEGALGIESPLNPAFANSFCQGGCKPTSLFDCALRCHRTTGAFPCLFLYSFGFLLS